MKVFLLAAMLCTANRVPSAFASTTQCTLTLEKKTPQAKSYYLGATRLTEKTVTALKSQCLVLVKPMSTETLIRLENERHKRRLDKLKGISSPASKK